MMYRALALTVVLSACVGCRAVTVVSDSILADNGLVLTETLLRDAVNDTQGENHVMATRIMAGATAFNHPINRDIYSKGLAEAFETPDAVVLSFATNDINRVRSGLVSYASAQEAFWTLVHQAVQAGATCVVVVEWSHMFRSMTGGEHVANAEFTPLMDQWFYDISQRAGESEYLGFAYTLVIADVSDTVHADLDRYIFDYIHPSPDGAQLLADAVVSGLSNCPEGRWVHNEGVLKEGFEHRVPWHLQ